MQDSSPSFSLQIQAPPRRPSRRRGARVRAGGRQACRGRRLSVCGVSSCCSHPPPCRLKWMMRPGAGRARQGAAPAPYRRGTARSGGGAAGRWGGAAGVCVCVCSTRGIAVQRNNNQGNIRFATLHIRPGPFWSGTIGSILTDAAPWAAQAARREHQVWSGLVWVGEGGHLGGRGGAHSRAAAVRRAGSAAAGASDILGQPARSPPLAAAAAGPPARRIGCRRRCRCRRRPRCRGPLFVRLRSLHDPDLH